MTITTALATEAVVPAETGYDAVADIYDSWHWSTFWSNNEIPLVSSWLAKLPHGTILDAGCGTGRYLNAISQLGFDYIGVDISARMLKECERRAVALRVPVTLLHCDITDIPLPQESVDHIVCARVLSHVSDLDAAFREFSRIIRVHGFCIITDIHPSHRYANTHIKVKSRSIRINTYKHPIQMVEDAAVRCGEFQVLNLTEHRLGDLPVKPDRHTFSKLYDSPNIPIYYSLLLYKSFDQ
jgi:ubiquinone/menaquinone biosynthesis C-methylase UbiE